MSNVSEEKIYKVLANTAQSFSNGEQFRARANIGALSTNDVGRTAITNNYNDLDNKPDLSIYAKSADLATVATSGSYTDLTDTPVIPAAQVNSDWNASSGVAQILNKPSLAAVATSGDYQDLSNTPSIPAAQVNSDWNASSGVAKILNKPSLATVATSGSYNDLSNTPSIPAAQVNSDWNSSSGVSQILNKPNLATVATSGSYTDLSNTPSIPAAQVNSDWNAVSGVAQILNKPSLATVATSGNYNDLSNTPVIPGPEVFIATYGTSTYSDIQTALTAGKLVVMKYNSSIYALPARVGTGYIYFTSAWMAGSLLTAGIRHFVCSESDGWYMYPHKLNGTMDIHLPSVQTSKVTTTLQDNFDDWLRIGDIVIGGHGTSNGNIQVGIKAYDASLAAEYLTDITHRTSYSGGPDNDITYGSVSTTGTYQPWFLFSQMDGTNQVECSYVINLYDTNGTNPDHIRVSIRKTFINQHTTLFLTGELMWGEVS